MSTLEIRKKDKKDNMKKNITHSKGFNISHIKWKTKLECSLTKTPKYTSKRKKKKYDMNCAWLPF